ncbi:hypothetical protein O181_004959 [Austropuccinia psidii MF-1]|uniref:Uncharacterized protein n=1 Tax=Austropuccinia psidii MF-1 TaxID=1389203 RepID=A0A9Q3BH84_9BASI|nr:hypothetical protein [Austropuccinia psidii MF-1]
MSSDSFCSHSESIEFDKNESLELVTSKSPTTPNIPLTAPMESQMNVFSLYIEKDFPITPPPFINFPVITVSSINNPTGTQAGNEYSPYPHDYPFNPSSTPSADQESRSHLGPEKKQMLKIPPLFERRLIDQFQQGSR